MQYSFHPEALQEYSEAVQYFAQQRTQLAQAFINEVESAVFRIEESPERYPCVDGHVRRCMTRKFPYALLYSVEQDYILILAVMHCSRKPGYWIGRK